MAQFDRELEAFIEAVKNTEAFIEYEKQKERIKAYPDLQVRLNEFRERNYRLQTSQNTAELFEEIDKFTIEYEAFREIPMIHNFLEKELAYCRMIQQIHGRLLEAFAADFE